MKLKRLQIHNIASIEDATIDFDRPPLDGSGVFLITGKTGAGKSTILDAICLALYGSTPRLKSTQMDGKTPDADDSLPVTDARQLMRRNTGEAWVRLSFEGSNGMDYEAVWAVARARKKAGGKLQHASRALTRTADGTAYTKKQDIDPEIDAAVGLDFNQFCRTTLLPQGQFARFLNSNDKEKAAILEKITGVDAYARIGRKVYEVTREKEQLLHDAQQRTEGLTALSDEEIAVRGQEEQLIAEQLREIDARRRELTAKTEWLDRRAEMERQVELGRAEYAAAKAGWEARKTEDKRRLVAGWNETVEVREHLAGAARAAGEMREAGWALDGKRREFMACLAAKERLERQLETDRQELVATKDKLFATREKSKAVEQAQTITAHLDTMEQARTAIAARQVAIGQTDIRIKALEEELKAGQTDLTAAQEAQARKRAALQAADERANGIPMAALREEGAELARHSGIIAMARDRIRALEKARQDMAGERQALSDLERQMDTIIKGIEAKEPEVEKSRLLVEERQRALDAQQDTVAKWTKKLRAGLAVGRPCPVCRQPVAELPQEGVLDALFEQARKDLDEAADANKKAVAELTALQNGRQVAATLLSGKQASALVAAKTLEGAQEAVRNIFVTLGVEAGADARERLDAMESGLHAAIEANRAAIAEGDKAAGQVRTARRELDEARAAAERVWEACDGTRKKIDAKRVEAKAARELIERERSAMAGAEAALAALLAGSGSWTNDWRTGGKLFAAELEAVACERRRQNDRAERLAAAIGREEEKLQRVTAAMEAVTGLYPSWRECRAEAGGSAGDPVADPEAAAGRLREDVAGWMARLDEATKRRAELDREVCAFLAANSRYTEEALMALNAYGRAEVDALGRELERLKSALDRAKALADNNVRLKAEHEGKNPGLAEGDDRESLARRQTDLEQQQRELQQRLGAIGQELRTNDKVVEQLKGLRDAVERVREEHRRWDRMNRLIGDATGDKFRRIAQSYVLAALAHAANHYMRTLAPRYTLHAQPGGFVIFIEDAYQGFVRRAVSTVSGGESFLVSLALALALSDIGNRLSVGTLFIDEGFGSLSGEPLAAAINTLRALHDRMGRHVGIISHVEELQERIPVQIKVRQEGNSSSGKVSVVAV